MRVLHVYKRSFPTTVGGIEVFIDNLSNHTNKLGVENTVLSLADIPQTKTVQVNTYDVVLAKQSFFVASTGFSWSAFKQYRELAASADIIHFYFPNPFSDLLYFFSPKKKPCLVTYQSDIIKQKNLLRIYKPLMKYFLGKMDRVIATTPKYLASSDVLQTYKDKVVTIPIGIPQPIVNEAAKEQTIIWKSKLPEKFFLFVGALRYYKGLSFAIEASQKTGIPLVIAGGGGVEEELKAQAEKSNAKDVHFLGFVSDDDKLSLLELCHGFIMASHLRSEAFGISLLEAAAMGKPLISCEIGSGTSYINEHETTGIVVNPASPSELAEAMETIYNDDKLAVSYGKAAFERYKALFTADVQAKKYIEVYNELIKSDI
jgi:rhamnosyl/mannosyltransferase